MAAPLVMTGLLAAALAALIIAPSLAQTESKAFGDWKLRCGVPPGAQSEQCELQQSVVAEDHPELTLLVAIKLIGTKRALKVIAPLGVLILPGFGLGLKIDETDLGRTSFVKCLAAGCEANVEMDDALVDQLKNGKVATFIVFRSLEEAVGIPVSLDGFADGLNALK